MATTTPSLIGPRGVVRSSHPTPPASDRRVSAHIITTLTQTHTLCGASPFQVGSAPFLLVPYILQRRARSGRLRSMRGQASRDRLLLPRRSRIQTDTHVVHSVAARTDAPTCTPERWRRPTTYRTSPRQTSASKARYSWKGGQCPVRHFRLGREVRPAREWKNRWPAQRPNVAAMMAEHDNVLCSSIFNLGRRLVYCLFLFLSCSFTGQSHCNLL